VPARPRSTRVRAAAGEAAAVSSAASAQNNRSPPESLGCIREAILADSLAGKEV
jgi:hypothetical protein